MNHPDLLKAGKFFRRRARRMLQSKEDQDDFVQECFAVWLEVGGRADVRLVAKSAMRNFLQDQKGSLRTKQYELLGAGQTDLGSVAVIGFADALDYGIPANPNDAASVRPYRLELGGVRFLFDKHDMAELLGIKADSVKTARSRGQRITLWEHGGALYRSVKELTAAVGKRASTAKQLAREVNLQWGA